MLYDETEWDLDDLSSLSKIQLWNNILRAFSRRGFGSVTHGAEYLNPHRECFVLSPVINVSLIRLKKLDGLLKE
jgi:hypothetical protein